MRFLRKQYPSNQAARSETLEAGRKQEIFRNTIKTVQDLLDDKKLDIEKAQVLEYAIEVIGGEFSYSVAARLLHWGKTPENAVYTIPAPRSSFQGTNNYSLSGLNVISDTYNLWKLSKAIAHVFLQGFRQINNYTGTLYPEINLVVVENGRHHLSAAAIKNTGSAKLQVCSLKEAFPSLWTDGAHWYSENMEPTPVYDCRLAILYELARIKNELLLPMDTPSLSVREFPVSEEVDPRNAYLESLFRSELLELELQIKKYQLQLLKGEKDVSSFDTELERLERVSAGIKKEFNDWIARTN